MPSRILIALSLLFSATWCQAEIAPDAWSVQPLLAGQQAPAFEAVAADGSQYRFDPEQRQKPAIITFYRGGWCPYCNLHLAEYREVEETLTEMGYELIFLSADQPSVIRQALEDMGEDEALPYTLLSDSSMTIAQQFGIAFKVDEATVARYLNQHQIDLEAASGDDHHALPVPATFLVDSEGLIRFQYVNPDYRIRIHPDVLVAAARTMPGRKLR